MKVGLLSLRVVPQQQCHGHCPCDSAQVRQFKQQLRGALVAGQWRGDTALILPSFWRRSTVSPVFFGRYLRSSLHSFVPSPPPPAPLSPSLTSHLASVDVKQNVLGKSVSWLTVCGDLWRKQSWRVAGWRKDVVTRCSEFGSSSLDRSLFRHPPSSSPPPLPSPPLIALPPVSVCLHLCLCLSVCLCLCLSVCLSLSLSLSLSLYVYVYERN